ncbi:Mutyh protein, partial [Piptocephalis cylindrospora]
VWISETMLQQTQVKTMTPYYLRWLEKFPTVEKLALASEDEVLGIWAGLGYYSRARRLHQAARLIMEEHCGLLPRTSAELQKEIPGIGRYTAGAIASIVYREASPVVDGNVIRLLSRLRGYGGNPKSSASEGRWVWSRTVRFHPFILPPLVFYRELAEELMNASDPANHNQAMMELGSLVCTPKQPKCTECPVQQACRAHAEVDEGFFNI